jgi:NADH dehydrogenase
VHVLTGSPVTRVDASGVELGRERIRAATVLWAAGVLPSALGRTLGVPLDPQGRVRVEPDLSVPGHPEVFVIGDQASVIGPGGKPLPGIAPVAMQQGRCVARAIEGDIAGRSRQPFVYRDKGQLATIGRSRAIVELGRLRFAGLFAWLLWIAVHIYYLTGFKNRLLVVIQWAWSYLTFRRGARLIVGKRWQFYDPPRDGES